MSLWVISCRGGLNFRRPLHPRKLPRLSPTGVAASHRPENPKSTATKTVATAGMPGTYSAVVGSITDRTRAIVLAGNPPFWACILIVSSSGALYTQ